MKDLDERDMNRKTLEEIRIRAVKRVEGVESPEVIIKTLGLTRPRIYKLVVGANPLQLRFGFTLWTRGMVQVPQSDNQTITNI